MTLTYSRTARAEFFERAIWSRRGIVRYWCDARKLMRRMKQQKTLLSQKDGRAMWKEIFPFLRDASLVIDGEEFGGNVVRYTESQSFFESDRSEEIEKNSLEEAIYRRLS